MSHNNNKGLVQERVAKFKGTGTVDFNTLQSGSTVAFSSTLTIVLQYNGATRQLVSQCDGFVATKKFAEQSAAGIMLAMNDFTFYTNHLNWNIQPSPGSNTSSVSQQQTFANAKGSLLEQLAKMTRRPELNFDTTRQAPFTCTLTLQPIDASDFIVVTSDHCPSKKEAEQQAAERMLNDARFGSIGRRGELVFDPLEACDTTITTTSSASLLLPASSDNHKGKLLERMAQSGGRVTFDCNSCPGGFCSVAVAQHVKIATTFTARSDGVYSSKKEADQAAARVMRTDPAFITWLGDGAGDRNAVSALGTTLMGVPRSPSGSVLRNSPVTSRSSSLASSLGNAPHLNSKGLLLERSVKMLPQPLLQYNTTTSYPFICTLTAEISPRDANSTATTITVVSNVCTTKKAAEQEAAAQMLAHSQFQSLGRTAVAATDHTTKCVKCSGVIGLVSDFCFYIKSETEVQFIVKPEIARLIIAKSVPIPGAGPLPVIMFPAHFDETVKSSQLTAIMCGHCRACIGAHSLYGPDGAALIAFRNTDIRLKGAIFASSRSWRQVYQEEAFTDVEQRAYRNFFGVADDFGLRPVLDLIPVLHPEVQEGLEVDECPDFQYTDLLRADCGKTPRAEQVAALRVALEHHAIVVFPTGFGKTLVASMVMHRYRRLNPAKLVLMVEERVPLVEQQCQAIERDTGLKMCPLYGENSSLRTVKQLLDGAFDGAVITAGALINYLLQDQLRVSDFRVIVFDESHHATKSHPYKLVTEQITRYPVYLQPRVLGLTASLLKGKTEELAYAELDMILETFLDADLYRPQIDTDLRDLRLQTVDLSPEQRAMQRKIVGELQPLVAKLSTYYAVHRPSTYAQLVGESPIYIGVDSNKFDWMRVTQLSAESYFQSGVDPQPIIEIAAHMRNMVAALEDNYLLGPSFVTLYGGMIEETIAADASLAAHHLKSGISPQLCVLCSILAECGAASCTLVFVETRRVATIVTAYIRAKFPHLNCQRMVGQSGEEGMRWGGEEGQREILKAFHCKECRLIVCTSVLEEGLDVKGCNLVIRLGGTPSLIRLVQSKGRARDENGELRLILTLEEESHLRGLLEQEAMLGRVLQEFSALAL